MKQRVINILKKLIDFTEPLNVVLIMAILLSIGAYLQSLDLKDIPIEIPFYVGSALYAGYSQLLAYIYGKRINELNKGNHESI